MFALNTWIHWLLSLLVLLLFPCLVPLMMDETDLLSWTLLDFDGFSLVRNTTQNLSWIFFRLNLFTTQFPQMLLSYTHTHTQTLAHSLIQFFFVSFSLFLSLYPCVAINWTFLFTIQPSLTHVVFTWKSIKNIFPEHRKTEIN